MTANEPAKTVVLGSEYDEQLRETLMRVLKTLGGTPKDASYGIGGSQELEALEVAFGDDIVVVEAETYVGLSVSGKAELVSRIAALVQAGGASG
jgi:hypothetical protein